MKYVYPCVIDYEPDTGYGVYFPDVRGAYASGETLYEALWTAEDVLNGMLASNERDGDEILPPTPIEKVVPEPNEYAVRTIVTLIKADTDAYREAKE